MIIPGVVFTVCLRRLLSEPGFDPALISGDAAATGETSPASELSTAGSGQWFRRRVRRYAVGATPVPEEAAATAGAEESPAL